MATNLDKKSMTESQTNTDLSSVAPSRSDVIYPLAGMFIGALIPIGFFAYDAYSTSAFLATLPESERQSIANCGMPIIGLFFGVPMLGLIGAFTGFGVSRLKRLL